jgi:ectoine hydroxylase-related dioxygenase (phytanoyl-CoA dioxygenase family)
MTTSQHIEAINQSGFTFIPNLISKSECEQYKALLERDYRRYASMYVGATSGNSNDLCNKSGEKVVFNMHNKDKAWFALFENATILEVADAVLKKGTYGNAEPYYLNNISARCPLRGHPGQQLHIDSNLPGNSFCLILNVLWLLDDFTLENGATRVVPGSHRWNSFAPDGESHPDEVRVTGQRGGALVFNANIWHGGAENTTDETRWAVALGYARWFIKPSFDFAKNTPLDVYHSLTDAQKDLLGFRLMPPKDEFTRMRRRSDEYECPASYSLPVGPQS